MKSWIWSIGLGQLSSSGSSSSPNVSTGCGFGLALCSSLELLKKAGGASEFDELEPEEVPLDPKLVDLLLLACAGAKSLTLYYSRGLPPALLPSFTPVFF